MSAPRSMDVDSANGNAGAAAAAADAKSPAASATATPSAALAQPLQALSQEQLAALSAAASPNPALVAAAAGAAPMSGVVSVNGSGTAGAAPNAGAGAAAAAAAAPGGAGGAPASPPQQFETRLLWDGAFECSLPTRFADIRRFRQVPDHQEVFADAATDQSVIIELNDMQSHVSDEKAAKYFLDDLAEVNEAKTNVLLQSAPLTAKDVPNLPADVYASYAIGEQKVTKYRDDASAANTVHIYLACFRLRQVTTDLLITFNVPVAFNAASSSAGRSLVSSGTNKQVIATLLSTFRILSLDMFVPPEQRAGAGAGAGAGAAAGAAPMTTK